MMKAKAISAINEMKKNRNHSLYEEIYDQNNTKKRRKKVAIEYRRNKITFEKLFKHVDEFALSLTAMGYKKGSEIVACVSNTPEYIYLLLAASKIGAKFNPIGEWFNKEYIKEIIEKSGSHRIFISDDNYDELRSALEESDSLNEIIAFSLHDSLPCIDGKLTDPYEKIDCHFKSFEDNTEKCKMLSSKKVLNLWEFERLGREYLEKMARKKGYTSSIVSVNNKELVDKVLDLEKVDLDDDFLITYTSGSTNPDRPKATTHPVKSLILLARFKKSDVSGMPTMKNVRVMAHIPSYVLANISTSITDPLYLGCTVIPEPIYDKDYFPYGIVLNKPNMSCGSNAFWRNLCMKLNYDETFKKIKLPYLYIPIVTGEAMGPGEEKFFNKTARKHSFGVAEVPAPLSPVTFSIGGGTNEITGIFVTLYRAFQERLPHNKLRRKTIGQTPLACAEVDIIDENGNSVKVGEYGEIVAKTECGMKGYTYQSELDEAAFTIERDGNKRYKMGAYGLKLDELPHVQIKGRLKDNIVIKTEENQEAYPLFKIDDIVARDTKNILSTAVVKVKDHDDEKIVIHIEPQPDAKIRRSWQLMTSIVERLNSEIPEELKDVIYLRYRSTEESFPQDPSGKRSRTTLQREGTIHAISYREIASVAKLDTREKTGGKKIELRPKSNK